MSNFSAVRKKNGLSCREWAEVLKEEFPKANAAGVSLAERPDESGITYTAEARRYIKDRFGLVRKPERRKDTARLSCWVSEDVKRLFEQAKIKRGFIHDKDYMVFLINRDSDFIEKAAHSGGTEQSGKENISNTILNENGGFVK